LGRKVEMNQIQLAYITAKAAYDTAVEVKDWKLVESLEEPYLDAEFELVQWALDQAENSGLVSPADLSILRRRWTLQSEKVIDLALRLAV
jgi:hypothetical protein